MSLTAHGWRGFTERVRALLVRAEGVQHLDETGFRIGGKTQWLHVLSMDRSGARPGAAALAAGANRAALLPVAAGGVGASPGADWPCRAGGGPQETQTGHNLALRLSRICA